MKNFIKNQSIAQDQQRLLQNTTQIMNNVLPPTSPVKTGRLECTYDNPDNLTFTFHAHTESPVPSNKGTPDRMIAICCYDDIYSYAVLGLDGKILALSDIPIPPHVDPRRGAHRSMNIVFEVANAIVKLAQEWNTWIGIEDTSWQRIQPTMYTNRRTVTIPKKKLITTIEYKAQAVGLIAPRKITNLSTRDCPHCYRRNDKDHFTNHRFLVATCPSCFTEQRIEPTTPQYICPNPKCARIYTKTRARVHIEHEYSCRHCFSPTILTRYARVIVAGQRMLIDCVHHHAYSRAKYQPKQIPLFDESAV